MGGGYRKEQERKIEKWQGEGRALRQQGAQDFETEAAGRISAGRAFVEPSLYDPTEFGSRVTESAQGAGREGYEEFSRTGGFSPEQEQLFLRRATGPLSAIADRSRQEQERSRVRQGGYSPGFTSGMARLDRQAGQDIAEGTMAAQSELEGLKRTGRLAGLGGLERTRFAAGREALDRVGLAQEGVSQQDVLRLQSRLQSGQLDQNDISMLINLRNNSPSAFQNIMQGIGTVAGAAAPFIPA